MQSIDGEGEVARNIEKVIDKPHKNRYILLYKCDEKECAPQQTPFREPGQGESPARRWGALSLLSRGGENSSRLRGCPTLSGHQGAWAESLPAQFGWYRGM